MSARSIARRGALTVVVLYELAFGCLGYAQDLNDIAPAVYQREVDAATQRGDLITSGSDYERVQRISTKLIAAAPEMRADSGAWAWEVAYQIERLSPPDSNNRRQGADL